MKHPMQKIHKDEHGTPRFVANPIVRFLLDAGPFDLNQLAVMNFSEADHRQLAQLIGYSTSGYGDLSYAEGDVSVQLADEQAGILIATSRGEDIADLEGDDLLQAFVDRFVDGAQGCSMEWEDAQALAVAIHKKLNPVDRREELPDGNIFKHFNDEPKPPLNDDAVFVFSFKTARDHENDRRAMREAEGAE